MRILSATLLTPAEVRAAIPAHATLQDRSALTGAYDPTDASWGGSVQVSTPSSIDTSVEDLYAKQAQIAVDSISELEQETPEDSEEAEDIQATLSQARAFKSQPNRWISRG